MGEVVTEQQDDVNAAVEAEARETHFRYMASSFWVTWEYLNWPDKDIADLIKARADQVAESGCNTVIMFGTHFRWDFLPILGRVHSMLAFLAEQLQSRGVKIFDHHSSVLTHRARNEEERWTIWQKNRHHLPFYPDVEFAKTLQYEGQFLNDWRVVDVDTGKPVWIETYTCEQFCMNNPGFRDGYQSYVRRLLREVPLDGLMSDDGLYYSYWHGCGCKWCKEKFAQQYGHELPEVSDHSFWGNRDSEAFKDWIEFRFKTVGEWLGIVKEAAGDTPLMSCCSTSEAQHCASTGLSYENFAPHSDLVMLEMCGSTPAADGTWNNRISSQLLQLAIARDADLPCLGLGYGYFRDSADFIWAINKFLGSDMWFSSLKGRLGQPASVLAELPEEPELVRECCNWERSSSHLFTGMPDAQVAVFYSRNTRDFYGQVAGDYVPDYGATCRALMEGQLTFEVTTTVPEDLRWPVLVVSSAICLSDDERRRLEKFMSMSGVVVATGPVGVRDGRARLLPEGQSWLAQFDIEAAIEESPASTAGGFPPYCNKENVIPVCDGQHAGRSVTPEQWIEVSYGKGKLLWSVGRGFPHSDQLNLAERVKSLIAEDVVIRTGPSGWYSRRFRDGNRLLIQTIPAKVEPVFHPTLRYQFGQLPIIESINYKTPCPNEICIEVNGQIASARLHSPDLTSCRQGELVCSEGNKGLVRFDITGVQRFATIEIVLL